MKLDKYVEMLNEMETNEVVRDNSSEDVLDQSDTVSLSGENHKTIINLYGEHGFEGTSEELSRIKSRILYNEDRTRQFTLNVNGDVLIEITDWEHDQKARLNWR